MNTYVHVCRSPREEPSAEYLLRVYRSEPLRRLCALRRALSEERTAAKTPDTVAWCDHRLPLVEQVIGEKADAEIAQQA